MNIVFRRINDLRVDNDIKTCDLAKRLGISQDNFFDYANARSNFPLEKLNKFVNFFKVNFDYVTGLSDNKIYYKGNIDLNLLKERLKKIRKERGISQSEIAGVLGDRQSTYWNYESGGSIIPISKLYLLAKFYNVSIDYFVGKTDDTKIK